MALQTQIIPVSLLGLDTHADPKSAPPGSFDLSENVFGRRTAGGGIEWRKRLGTTSRTRNILGGGTVSNARKLAKYGNEQLLVTDTKLYSWSSIAGAWIDRGALSPIGIRTRAVSNGVQTRDLTTAAVGGGYLCQISRGGASAFRPVCVTIIDLASNTKVLADAATGLSCGSTGFAHVIALDTCFMIVQAVGNGNINAVKIPYATPTTISAITVVATNGSVATTRMDAVRNGTADQVLIAYNGDAANRMRGILWNSNMTSAGAFLHAEQPDGAIGWLHHDYLDGFAYAAYVDSTRGTKVLKVDIATWTVSSATLLDVAAVAAINVTGQRTGGANQVFIEVAGAQTYLNQIQRSTGGAFAVWHLGLGLWSRTFKVGTSYYVGATYADGLQDKYFVLNATTATPAVIGQALDGLGFGITTLPFSASVPAISATAYAMPVSKFETEFAGTDDYGSAYLELEFSPVTSGPRQIGETLVFPGGVVRAYDGRSTSELGFHVFPKVFGVTQTTGGSLTLLATYTIVYCYAQIDGAGQVHRSAPSDPVTVTLTGSNNKILFSLTNYRIGDKPLPADAPFGAGNCQYERYATKANGSTLYLVSSTANDPTIDSTSISFSTEPPGTHGELYTTGRALPHNAFPPANLIEVWGDRAFFAQTDEPEQLWVSDEIESGLGLSVSQVNVLPLPSDDGDVTSLNEFDDRVVIGKASALYQLSGSGPASNGDGQYQAPSRVNSVVGPTSQNGVTKTTNGLIFTASHGRYLLPRGGADPVRLAKIEGYDGLTVTGASNVDGYEQTRFVTDSGRTLVYHYGLPDESGLGRWSTFTGQTAVDCANFGGAWCYLSSDGTVHVEVAGQYADDGVAYTRTDSLAWINGGGMFSNIRLKGVKLLGDVLSAFTITGTLAYDYDPTVVDTKTKAVTTATIGLLEIAGSRGRMDAIHIAISETSTGEGYRLSALALEIGVKPGFAKAAAGAFLT